MKNVFAVLFTVVMMFGGVARAETQEVNSVLHGVIIEMPVEHSLPNGSKVMAGGRNHSVAVGEDGQTFSQWCNGSIVTEASGTATGAGHCSIIADNGDVFWVWFRNNGAGSEGTWGVIGGTGEYEGASGGGKTDAGKLLGDGRSFVSTSKGKIKTK